MATRTHREARTQPASVISKTTNAGQPPVFIFSNCSPAHPPEPLACVPDMRKQLV